MQSKRVPERMCIACKSIRPKNELIRIVRTEDGFVIDRKGKMNGRGSYICNSEECLNKLCKNKVLNKVFKTNISNDVYDSLKEKFFENREN